MDNKEKGAVIIGRIVLVVTIASFAAIAGIILWLFLTMRSCYEERHASNTGKELYTADYIENYLEERYNTEFTFVSESEDNSVEHDTIHLYKFKDSDGVEFCAAQHRFYGIVMNGHYEVRDSYYSEKLLSDKAFMDKLEGCGFRYTIEDPMREEQTRIISVTVKDEDAEAAIAFFYDLALESELSFQPKPEKYKNLYSQPPCVYMRSRDGRLISTQNLVLYDSEKDVTEEERKEYIDDAVYHYKMMR